MLALLLLAAEPPALDLKPGSAEQTKVSLDVWMACIAREAKDAGQYTNDPSDVVADVAIFGCEAEQDRATFDFMREILTRSKSQQTYEAARASAVDFMKQRAVSVRGSTMVSVSYERRNRAMREAARAKP